MFAHNKENHCETETNGDSHEISRPLLFSRKTSVNTLDRKHSRKESYELTGTSNINTPTKRRRFNIRKVSTWAQKAGFKEDLAGFQCVEKQKNNHQEKFEVLCDSFVCNGSVGNRCSDCRYTDKCKFAGETEEIRTVLNKFNKVKSLWNYTKG